MLTVNADDLGRSEKATDSILTCYRRKRIHTASAMVFMRDSQRSAQVAAEAGLGVGLHLNLIEEFTGESADPRLRDHHGRVVAYLRGRRLNQVVYNPFLRRSFEYVFKAQWDEFCRLYGREPRRLDGHHHMHLCMNMVASLHIPHGVRVRRSFTFGPGEKGIINRGYRRLIDTRLKARYGCSDCFFSIVPMETQRLRRLIGMAREADVELMVHPEIENEREFLLGERWRSLLQEAISQD
jgi:predicted glycoside hydrolase/deacetylase ChbG (UPF0249 family)